jgi:hypothetical protein
MLPVFYEASRHEFLWKSNGAVPQIYEMTNVNYYCITGNLYLQVRYEVTLF